MIQAEIGGAARVDPGTGVQRPGFMIRDFTLTSLAGESVRLSSFRGRSNLVVVFPGCSGEMRVFLEQLARHGRELQDQDAMVLAVLPEGRKEPTLSTASNSPLVALHDETHRVYRLFGAMDENARPIPLIHLTDRFGEIVSTYVASAPSMPPSVDEILSTLEFVNQRCPECEPPEWPR